MNALWQIIRLLWQPKEALRELYERAPYRVVLLVSWLAVTLYLTVASGAAELLQRGSAHGTAASLLALRVAASGANRLLAARNAALLTFFVAVIFTPVLLLIGNALAERLPAGQWLRVQFRATATCVLGALAGACLLSLAPAAVIGWQAARQTTDVIPTAFALLALLPVPIFLLWVAQLLTMIFPFGWAKAVLLLVFTLPTLLLLIPLAHPLGVAAVVLLLMLLATMLLRKPSTAP